MEVLPSFSLVKIYFPGFNQNNLGSRINFATFHEMAAGRFSVYYPKY